MNAPALLRRGRQPAVAITPKELLVRAGRIALWLALVIVLVRGLAEILSAEPASEQAAAGVGGRGWPDDAARAFAVEFASVYLEHFDGHDLAGARAAMTRFASTELSDGLAPRLEARGPRQSVGPVTVAEVERLDRDHALITLVASVTGRASRTLRLAIPVARNANGGLAVYDLPAVAADPRRATVDAPTAEPLAGEERDAISDVLARFFRGYLAGDTGALAYLVPPGTRPAAAAGGFELVELASIGAIGRPVRGGRLVLATIDARDQGSGAVLALRYRVRMVHRDRWYVAAVNQGATG